MVAQQFHEALEPLVEWLTATEKRLANAEPIGTQASKLQQQISQHKVRYKPHACLCHSFQILLEKCNSTGKGVAVNVCSTRLVFLFFFFCNLIFIYLCWQYVLFHSVFIEFNLRFFYVFLLLFSIILHYLKKYRP